MYSFHPDNTKPKDGEIFVFGSNLAGIHGAGAAKAAFDFYGAEWGKGAGLVGNSYAIPTKDSNIISLKIEDVIKNIYEFVNFTNENVDKTFFVTRVGCGLAGFSDEQIAKHFTCARNCSFAFEWKKYLCPEEWQIPVKCIECNDIIWSSRQGEFVTCACGATSVDQTKHYARYIGKACNFIKKTTINE